MGHTTKTESYRFEHFGDNTVSTAAELIDKLPNGWVLKSLMYRIEVGCGSWVAIVQGPEESIHGE